MKPRPIGDETRAIEAYARVFYEFPLSEVAPMAKARLDGFPNFQRLGPDTQRYKLEFGTRPASLRRQTVRPGPRGIRGAPQRCVR